MRFVRPGVLASLAVACISLAATATLVACFGSGTHTTADAGFDATGFDSSFDDASLDGGPDGSPPDSAPATDGPHTDGPTSSDGGTGSDSSSGDAGVDAPPPTPVVVTTGVPTPYTMAVDGQNLYWSNLPADADGGAVMKVSLSSGTVATLITAAQETNASSIAVDSKNVYASVDNTLALVSVPIGGGTVSTLMTFYYESSPIAVGAGAVLGTMINSGVWAVPVDGGTPVNYVQQPYGALTGATDGTSYFWIQSAAPNAIRSAPLGAASMPAVTQLVTNPADSGNLSPVVNTAYQNLAVDGTSVYWFDNGSGSILSAPKGGGAFKVIAQVPVGTVQSLLTDGTTLYWAQTTPPAILKMPVAGGTPQTLVSGAPTAALATLDGEIPRMAIDATHLYWFNPPDIYEIAR
jgi:hypothetical protein